jgi:hypothetical protein
MRKLLNSIRLTLLVAALALPLSGLIPAIGHADVAIENCDGCPGGAYFCIGSGGRICGIPQA